MSFLQHGLWFWLAPLVALPALIHLLNRRFPFVLPFSSVRLIKQTMAQRSKLFRWRHLILAILRTVALLLLLLAFLKPVQLMFGSKPDASGPRQVLVLIDHSLSMESRENSLVRRKRAALEFEKIVSTLQPSDLVNVRVIGRDAPACFPEFSPDHAEALSFVNALEPGYGRADFNQAAAAIAPELMKIKGREEVYFISDFQRATWADVDLSALPQSARLFFVNVAPGERANHGITGAKIETANGTVLRVDLVNFAPGALSCEAEAIIDGKRSFKTDASVAAWSVGQVSIPFDLAGAGLHTIEVRLPEDDLPQDDHYFLTSETTEKEEVLVVTDATGGKQQSAGFFLMKALNPYEGKAGTVRPKAINSAGLKAPLLTTPKKVFLTTLDPLRPETCTLLAKYVQAGGSLVYFCDGKADAENLRRLDLAAGGEMAPLQLNAKQEPANLPSGGQQIARGDFKSKYLRVFQGAQRQNLGLMQFFEYYQAVATPAGRVLLNYGDGTPALAVTHPALGTVLVCNFSVDELASNMARQRAFPAWIQDLVKTLESGDARERSYEPGEEIRTEMWQAEMRESGAIGPDGRAVRTNMEAEGDRYHVSFIAAQPGVYRLGSGAGLYAFPVNPPAEESDLRSVDVDALPRRLESDRQAHFVEGESDFRALNNGRPLFHFFIFGVLAMLLAELAAQILFRRLART